MIFSWVFKFNCLLTWFYCGKQVNNWWVCEAPVPKKWFNRNAMNCLECVILLASGWLGVWKCCWNAETWWNALKRYASFEYREAKASLSCYLSPECMLYWYCFVLYRQTIGAPEVSNYLHHNPSKSVQCQPNMLNRVWWKCSNSLCRPTNSAMHPAIRANSGMCSRRVQRQKQRRSSHRWANCKRHDYD